MTVTLAQVQAAMGGRVTARLVSKRENIVDSNSTPQQIQQPGGPVLVGTGPGESVLTRRTWFLTSLDNGRCEVEIMERTGDLDADILARVPSAAADLRRQANGG